jgi:ribosome-associated translation inhibitor RaiA
MADDHITVVDQEIFVEDIHEGMIQLDRVLKLLKPHEGFSVLTRRQTSDIAFYIASRIARDFEAVREHPPMSEAIDAALEKLESRFDKVHKRVLRLRLLG